MAETQTYTFDTSDDPVAIEQAEQRDAETLEIGEKMMAEQENLLAGKYKNAEELETAYKELEKKLGEKDTLEREAGDEEVPVDTKKETSEENLFPDSDGNKLEGYLEDGSVNYDSVNTLYGEKLGSIFKESNVDPFEISKHFHKNNGEITDEMYKSLTDTGLSKSAIDSYLTGRAKQMGYDIGADATSNDLGEDTIKEMQGLAGGPEGYSDLMGWATDNLSETDINAFDDVIATGNASAVRFAIKALMGQYEDAVGVDSNLVQGKKTAPVEGYRSMAEVVRDMNNPLYDKDDAYRADVRRKLEQSNLKL
jgi:hypothetical protein